MAFTPPGQTRRKVFLYVRERLMAGAPPTVREVQEAFGFKAVESARSHLDALVEMGMLTKAPGRSRGYRLSAEYGGGRPTVLVPLLGQVQAGNLTTAVEDPAGYLAIHSRAPAGELFALQVRGESMAGVGIRPDDIVIVRRQSSAELGDVVVALVDDEATVKTLRRRGSHFVLEPENPEFETIVPENGALFLLGKVVEVRRYLEQMPLIEADLGPLLPPPLEY